MVSKLCQSMRQEMTDLLFPALKFIDEEVVALGDFRKLAIHSTLEVDEILPGFHSVS